MRGKPRFRQADIERALRAMTKSGLRVGRVEIDLDGKITIYPSNESSEQVDELEAWRAEQRRLARGKRIIL